MAKKILIGAIILILIMLPTVVAGAIIQNPIGFIGEVIFGTGDTSNLTDEIREMYDSFIETDLGKQSLLYIEDLQNDKTIRYRKSYYLLPCLICIPKENTDHENQTLESTGLKEMLDITFQLRQANTLDEDYILNLKLNDVFMSLSDISNTTLLMYMNKLGGSEIVNIEGLPGSTDDLRTIAQGDIYIGSSNPFVVSGYRGQCTWWCWSRAKELTGHTMPTGNARDWYSMTNLPTGTEPRTHSVLALWDAYGEGKQHVIFIENYQDGVITFSEGNIGGDGSVEYTEAHYLELLNFGQMDYNAFRTLRMETYDMYRFIYTD